MRPLTRKQLHAALLRYAKAWSDYERLRKAGLASMAWRELKSAKRELIEAYERSRWK